MQSCTCSRAFLLRRMMRETILGAEEWKPFFVGFMCSNAAGDQFDEAVVIEITGGGDDNVAGREAVGVGFNDGRALEALHGFLRAEDRLAQRMILPEVLGKDFVDEIVWIVFVHLDLFHDDAALAGYVGGIKDGV